VLYICKVNFILMMSIRTGSAQKTSFLTPWKGIFKQHSAFFIPMAAFLLLGGLLQLQLGKRDLFLFINNYYSDWADRFFALYTHVGDGLFCVLVILLLLFIKYGYALAATVAFLLSAGVSAIMKHLIFASEFRPRKYFEAEPGLIRFIENIDIHSANSFPSGHTVTSFAIFAILSFMIKDKRWGALFFVIALLAGFSRVYLAQHFFEDVYWGAFIGVLASIVVWYTLLYIVHLPEKQWWNKALLANKYR
jgi:membrane-associated phospholipid phosphatase